MTKELYVRICLLLLWFKQFVDSSIIINLRLKLGEGKRPIYATLPS